MKIFITNGSTNSSYKIVHMIGAKDNYTITENNGTLTYTGNDGLHQYIINDVAKFYWKKGLPIVSTWSVETAPFI